MQKKRYTVEDIFQLLMANGASRDPKSPIRIWDYDQLIPSRKFLNNLKTLGKGGYGSVYKINIDGLDYALKIMTQKRGETQQELINNFYNECKSLLSVNHNRVLRIVGVAIDSSDEDEYCFCHYTNYQQKGNLFDLIRNKQLFPDAPQGSPLRFYKKLRLLSQIAEGIHAIHAVGLIHRDIKAQNVFLDENDAPKVADLGLAGDDVQMTTTKARGTGQWMAPEVFEYKVSPASDIWALACVAIEIFNETLPYPHLKDMSQIRDFICNQRGLPQFSDEIRQDKQLERLLLQSFHYNTQERPRITDFRQSIEQIKQNYEIGNINQMPDRYIQPDLQSNQTQSEIYSKLMTRQNIQITGQNISQVYGQQSFQFQTQIIFPSLSFLKDSSTLVTKKNKKFEELTLQNSTILIDEESSVLYTQNYVFVSGGKSNGQCAQNFQMIDRNTFKVLCQCQMQQSRRCHEMVQIIKQNKVYIYIIPEELTLDQYEETFEYFDVTERKCKQIKRKLFQLKIFKSHNKVSLVLIGAVSQKESELDSEQILDFNFDTFKVVQQDSPFKTSIKLIKDQKGATYIFGQNLNGVYQLSWNQYEYQCNQISENSYSGKSYFQNPILQEDQIFVWDGEQINVFDLQNQD